jgi:hypothetical protein
LINHSDGLNKTKGFAFNEINWIDDYCNVTTNGALFGVLNLKNCYHDETISFTITLFCPSSEPFSLNVDSMEDFNEIIVFPNPSTSLLNITSEELRIKEIQLFDIKGLLIKEVKELSDNSIVLPLMGVASGKYLLRIVTHNDRIVTKRIIIK